MSGHNCLFFLHVQDIVVRAVVRYYANFLLATFVQFFM